MSTSIRIGDIVDFMSFKSREWTAGKIEMCGVDDFWVVGLEDRNDTRSPYVIDEGKTWKKRGEAR